MISTNTASIFLSRTQDVLKSRGIVHLAVTFTIAGIGTFARATNFSDDFESFSPGKFVTQNGWFTRTSGLPASLLTIGQGTGPDDHSQVLSVDFQNSGATVYSNRVGIAREINYDASRDGHRFTVGADIVHYLFRDTWTGDVGLTIYDDNGGFLFSVHKSMYFLSTDTHAEYDIHYLYKTSSFWSTWPDLDNYGHDTPLTIDIDYDRKLWNFNDGLSGGPGPSNGIALPAYMPNRIRYVSLDFYAGSYGSQYQWGPLGSKIEVDNFYCKATPEPSVLLLVAAGTVTSFIRRRRHKA